MSQNIRSYLDTTPQIDASCYVDPMGIVVGDVVLAENVSEDEIIEHLTLVKRRFEMNGGINLSKGYSLIKDTPEKAFRYADEMLYADKLSKKRRNFLAENI